MIEIDRIDHFVMRVENVEATCAFYAEVLGMEAITYGGENERRALRFGRYKIDLHPADTDWLRAKDARCGGEGFCLITRTPMEDVIAHLEACGVPIEVPPGHRMGALGTIRSVYFRDPDGNLVEVANCLTGSSSEDVKWNHVAKLRVQGRRLAAKDAMILLDPDAESPEWPCVTVEPGRYVFEINVRETWHCSRLRVVRVGSSPELGQKLGDFSVDHAKAAVIDYETFLAAVRGDFDAYEEWTGTALDDELSLNFSGRIDFGSTALVYSTSGDGDGTYPAFELVEGERVVGIECHFDVAPSDV